MAGTPDRSILRPTGPDRAPPLSKIDQHDAVLFDDADQQDEADDGDDAEIDVDRHQLQERSR